MYIIVIDRYCLHILYYLKTLRNFIILIYMRLVDIRYKYVNLFKNIKNKNLFFHQYDMQLYKV